MDNGSDYIAQFRLLRKEPDGFETFVEISTPIFAENDLEAHDMATVEIAALVRRNRQRHLVALADQFAQENVALIVEHKDHGGWKETPEGLRCAADDVIVTPSSNMDPQTVLGRLQRRQDDQGIGRRQRRGE